MATAPKLGLIAGSGRLPFEVAEAARDRGTSFAIAAIEQNTDPAIEKLAAHEFIWFAAGELGRLIDFLHSAGCGEVILAGAVAKPELLRDPSVFKPDARALSLLARLVERGDDAILRGVADELESEGLPVVPSTRHLGDRVAAPGLIAGPEPEARVAADLALGLRVARHFGAMDVGQSVVVKEGAVIAVEAIEGTDRTLERGAALVGPGAVLVKAPKPGQDLRFDVPAIGPVTIELARSGGIVAIGLEAHATLILERARTLAAAEAAGISLVGLSPEAP